MSFTIRGKNEDEEDTRVFVVLRMFDPTLIGS
jgi:hypothetical protein